MIAPRTRLIALLMRLGAEDLAAKLFDNQRVAASRR